MGLETGNFPSDLVESNPLGTDDKSQGDDHLRLIKHVLKTTFPALDAAVTSTPDELNAIQDTTLFLQAGMIVMWSGTVANVPDGFNLCDGLNGTPDLTGRFIVGSSTDVGGAYDIGDVGGTDTNTHAHSATIAGHILTEAQMPNHSHTSGMPWEFGAYGTATIPTSPIPAGSASSRTRSPITSTTGGGAPHDHGITINDAVLDNRPPFYALAFIIKT